MKTFEFGLHQQASNGKTSFLQLHSAKRTYSLTLENNYSYSVKENIPQIYSFSYHHIRYEGRFKIYQEN